MTGQYPIHSIASFNTCCDDEGTAIITTSGDCYWQYCTLGYGNFRCLNIFMDTWGYKNKYHKKLQYDGSGHPMKIPNSPSYTSIVQSSLQVAWRSLYWMQSNAHEDNGFWPRDHTQHYRLLVACDHSTFLSLGQAISKTLLPRSLLRSLNEHLVSTVGASSS